MPTDFGKGAVAVTTRGQLFVALGRLYEARGVESGWYGIGFNGERVRDDEPEFLAKNLNAYLTATYEEKSNVESIANVSHAVTE